MRNTIYLLLFTMTLIQCSPKKTETSQSTTDSVAVDSVLATSPAPSLLAFSPIEGFVLDNTFVLTDTINCFLVSTQQELNMKFGTSPGNPDFLINYIVGVACKPTTELTTIVMDKVETGTETIDVYLTIQRGARQKRLSKPAQLFAIERRDGYLMMQFYVNGKKDKALLLALAE